MLSTRQISKGDHMDIHKNVRLTPHRRAELVRRVLAKRSRCGPLWPRLPEKTSTPDLLFRQIAYHEDVEEKSVDSSSRCSTRRHPYSV